MSQNEISISRLTELFELRTRRVQRERFGKLNGKWNGHENQKPANRSLDPLNGHADSSEFERDVKLYHPTRLNEQQKRIFDYVFDHPGDIVLVQAGPGTGKTFTMLSIAYACKKTVKTVIYKHDLLYPFRYCAQRLTTAKFCMELFGLSFAQYKALDKQIASKMSVEELMISIVGLLRRALINSGDTLDDCEIVIMDEHTLIPKILLFVMLLVSKVRPATFVFCGDKNQLHNIHNSVHAGEISSYDIIAASADRVFNLDRNERCKDKDYNAIVEYVSRFSCAKRLDEFAFALVAAVFYDRLTTAAGIRDTHIAGTHKMLTDTVANLVSTQQIPVSFYFIFARPNAPKSRVRGTYWGRPGLYLPHASNSYVNLTSCGKFLPYLPLVVGGRYFVQRYSESTISTLISFDMSKPGNEEVCMRRQTGELVKLKKGACESAMFEEHAKYLLGGGDEAPNYVETSWPIGTLYNFPIYPANVMSVHMCQGRTITTGIDLMLENCSYEQLYVAISRVTERSKFTRVLIPDTISYLVTAIINFEKLALHPDRNLNVEDIERAFCGNYKLYNLRRYDSARITSLQIAAVHFVVAKSATERCALRAYIIDLCRDTETSIVTMPNRGTTIVTAVSSTRGTMPSRQIDPRLFNLLSNNANSVDVSFKFTLSYFLKRSVIFYPLALMERRDAFVWIREYLVNGSPLKIILSDVLDQKRIRLLFDDNGSSSDDSAALKTLRKINSMLYGYRSKETTKSYIERVTMNEALRAAEATNDAIKEKRKVEKGGKTDTTRNDRRKNVATPEASTGDDGPEKVGTSSRTPGPTKFASRILARGSAIDENWLLSELSVFVESSLLYERNAAAASANDADGTARQEPKRKVGRKVKTLEDMFNKISTIRTERHENCKKMKIM